MPTLEMAERRLVPGVPATQTLPGPQSLLSQQPGPSGWAGRWCVGENVAYVSEEKGGGLSRAAGVRIPAA